ncbi:MAG: hypothetical protein Q9221_004152 [Calogaya cf. arnoldii]
MNWRQTISPLKNGVSELIDPAANSIQIWATMLPNAATPGGLGSLERSSAARTGTLQAHCRAAEARDDENAFTLVKIIHFARHIIVKLFVCSFRSFFTPMYFGYMDFDRRIQ